MNSYETPLIHHWSGATFVPADSPAGLAPVVELNGQLYTEEQYDDYDHCRNQQLARISRLRHQQLLADTPYMSESNVAFLIAQTLHESGLQETVDRHISFTTPQQLLMQQIEDFRSGTGEMELPFEDGRA